MSQPQPNDKPADDTPARQPKPVVLGGLGGPVEHSGFEVPAQPPPLVLSAPEQPAEPVVDRPLLPRGALVVLRKSGGLRFTTSGVIVYKDGRVVYRRGEDAGVAARLTATQSDELAVLLANSQIGKLPTSGRPAPDGYTYEIVARIGRRARFSEVFDGSIPATLAPLIAWLLALIPLEEHA